MSLPVIAAWTALGGFAALIVMHVALALGAPPRRLVWGGQYDERLPTKLRIGSVCSALLFVFGSVCLAEYLGLIHLLGWVEGLQRVALAFTVLLGLSTLANLMSPSRKERFIMTPLALVLTLACGLVALYP